MASFSFVLSVFDASTSPLIASSSVVVALVMVAFGATLLPNTVFAFASALSNTAQLSSV